VKFAHVATKPRWFYLVSLLTEEAPPQGVVNAIDLPALGIEIRDDIRAD
jgi:hypothetical protein